MNEYPQEVQEAFGVFINEKERKAMKVIEEYGEKLHKKDEDLRNDLHKVEKQLIEYAKSLFPKLASISGPGIGGLYGQQHDDTLRAKLILPNELVLEIKKILRKSKYHIMKTVPSADYPYDNKKVTTLVDNHKQKEVFDIIDKLIKTELKLPENSVPFYQPIDILNVKNKQIHINVEMLISNDQTYMVYYKKVLLLREEIKKLDAEREHFRSDSYLVRERMSPMSSRMIPFFFR